MGSAVGTPLGWRVGTLVGSPVGFIVGFTVGSSVGLTVGSALGTLDGSFVGSNVGSSVGFVLGDTDGVVDGDFVGLSEAQNTVILYTPFTVPSAPGLAPVIWNIISVSCSKSYSVNELILNDSPISVPLESIARIEPISKSEFDASTDISP